MDVVHKVLAYITHGDRLLVFDHVDFPDAGTQVPAGTREVFEDSAAAVLREAIEETGLSGLRLNAFLGQFDVRFPDRDLLHRHRFYHLICDGQSPQRWRHFEDDPSTGGEPILFELYWVSFPEGVPELAPGHDAMFDALQAYL